MSNARRPIPDSVRDAGEALARVAVKFQEAARTIERGKHRNRDYWRMVDDLFNDVEAIVNDGVDSERRDDGTTD